jgi:hypothetical protein
VKAFGTYGDILIRDRKMYVVPTPFRLIEGVAHLQTLVLPMEIEPPRGFVSVGRLVRREANEVIVGYSFNLKTNELSGESVPNPTAGRRHEFRAWRVKGMRTDTVSMRSIPSPRETAVEGDEDEDV